MTRFRFILAALACAVTFSAADARPRIQQFLPAHTLDLQESECESLECFGVAVLRNAFEQKTLTAVAFDNAEDCATLNPYGRVAIPCSVGSKRQLPERTDLLRKEGDTMYFLQSCFSLRCFAKEAILAAWRSDRLQSVRLKNDAECKLLTFAHVPAIGCLGLD